MEETIQGHLRPNLSMKKVKKMTEPACCLDQTVDSSPKSDIGETDRGENRW